jgi:hypothetical protein
MSRARIMFPRYQDQAPPTEAPVFTASPGRHPGWRRWRQWAVWCLPRGRRRQSAPRLDHLWDAPHEQACTQTADHYQDFIIQEQGPALRLAMYQHVALS